MSADILLRNGVVLPGSMVDHMLSPTDSRYTATWFDSLPTMVAGWCDRWDITLDPEIPNLSYTVVLFGHSASMGDVVLKLSPPDDEFTAEIAGIRNLQGPGFVRLIHADTAAAGIVMERVRPGTPLRAFDDRIDDATATAIGAEMLKRIWRPAPRDHGDLFTLDRWFQKLFVLRDQIRDGRTDVPFSLESVEFAASLAETLLQSNDAVVLHGDMHHGNILENESGDWTIIDPKGLTGDRAYDVGTWLLNGWPDSEPDDHATILRRRLDIFARDLDLPHSRVLTGALVHFALCIAWATVESTPEQQASDEWLEGTLRAWAVADQIATEEGLREKPV